MKGKVGEEREIGAVVIDGRDCEKKLYKDQWKVLTEGNIYLFH
jgi:hypothetical protein